jgi:hypothetical protein
MGKYVHDSIIGFSKLTRVQTYQEAHFSRRRLIFTDEQMLFECDTCKRSESMLLSMGEEEDHSEFVFGRRPGGPQSARKFQIHIQLYSRRTLTYPSDILNALDGLFSTFAKVSKHFWGIPTNTAAYYLSGSGNEELPLLTLHTVLAHGLTWDKKGSMPAKRRVGFPSWSWSGWIIPVQWFHAFYRDVVARNPVHLALQKLDGTSTELTEALIDELSTHSAESKLVYTSSPLLRIEAEILRVKFAPEFRPGRNPIWSVVHTGADDEPRWIFYSTYEVEEDDELVEALSTQTFDCIVLTRNVGLVVGEINSTTERIGTIWLSEQEKHLRDYVYGEVRSIVVG